jgi:solute:Na+ symporter, SSS family
MLWKRTTSAGGFWGLLAGTASSVGMWAWVKVNPSAVSTLAFYGNAQPLAQDVWRGLWCWIVCVVVTVVVSLLTRPKPDSELVGLVMGVTPIPSEGHLAVYQRPVFWAVIVLIALVAVNFYFR